MMSTLLSRTEFWVLGLAGAAFVALFWALRGAPIGQATEDEGEEAPRAAYRDRVIAAVTAGLLLVIAGAYIALVHGVPWSIPAFAAGFGIVLTLIAFNQRYRHASPAIRRTLEFSNSALTATLLAGVLIVINVMAFRYGGRPLDFTREGVFSLEPQTVRQVASLDRPTTFTLFSGKTPSARIASERMKQLLDLYRAANPRMVRLATIDTYREPEKYESILKTIPEVAVTQAGGVLIEYGEGDRANHVVVRNNDLFDITPGGELQGNAARFESKFHGEDALTSALITLRQAKKPKIVFTTGHGEPSLDVADPARPGSIGIWKSSLTAKGSEVAGLNLLTDEIPDDASLLVVVGPRTPLKPDEVQKIQNYLEKGNPALLMLSGSDKSGLEELLKTYNIELGQRLIVDRRYSLRGRPQVIYVPVGSNASHPIVESLADRYILMPAATALNVLGTGGASLRKTPLAALPILRTSRQSWAESDLAKQPIQPDAGVDENGPLTVGVAVMERPSKAESGEGKPRLVVFSSGAMADNPVIELEPTNQDLLMNATSWLRQRDDLTGITPKTHVALTLTADPILRFRLIMVPTVMAVILILGLGLSTYLARHE